MKKSKKSRLAVIIFCVLLAVSPSFTASALGEANITPETTMAELRANESLQAAGFDTFDKGFLYLFNENEKLYANSTLWDYVGKTAPEAADGLNLIIENYNAGVQITYKLYTEEEIAADITRDKAELYYFPANVPNAKYAIIVPGNLGERSSKIKGGCATASVLHNMGYAVFVLRYSIWLNASNNAPVHELARAVRYITDNADSFGVQTEDYAIFGYSAGGQISGLFGTDRMGYKNYGLPKPGALILSYPVVDYNIFMQPLYFYAIDGAVPGEQYYNAVLSKEITPDYPPTYHWFGLNDGMLYLLGFSNQGYALERALVKNEVNHKMVVYKNAPHAIGLGNGTDAEGWIYDAVAFWEEVVADDANDTGA